ncbi:hypothetical protein DET57_12320 [Klebsiella oxytoca]|uniref:Uncharacterized protein n=1 Tax=Klebsiella oxytoca TaxID=571 RepID=A0A318FBE9_KLEOX|nr:hypothetical protein DET57_12320 [Klebsiella oxytoca]
MTARGYDTNSEKNGFDKKRVVYHFVMIIMQEVSHFYINMRITPAYLSI